jgi:N-hydroxyarylamine O-acetyltransferase
MSNEFDLSAYFERIGYGGPATPQLETLRELHRLHPQEIAFENLNPLMRWPVPLDIQSLQQKLVKQRRGGYCYEHKLKQRRGGYCYEHNLLLKHALERMGFRVAGLAARVLMNLPEDAIRPRTHMLLQIDIEDEIWIADVGFGGMTLTAPLRLVEHVPQATPHEPFRLTRLGGDYALQAEVRGEWRTSYRFDLQEQVLPDYELTSWYLSNNPESHFVQRLIAARTAPQKRYALRQNELAIHELNGETMRRVLKSAEELRDVLSGTFGIGLPQSRELDEKLQEIAASG